MVNNFSEEALELETIKLFQEQLNYNEFKNCFDEKFGCVSGSEQAERQLSCLGDLQNSFSVNSTLGRENSSEVVLVPKLTNAIEKLNPHLPVEVIKLVIEEITKDRSSLSPVQANKEVYKLLKDGVNVIYKTDEGIETEEVVKIIDWNTPKNNDFFLASQFWVLGEHYKRRADLIVFVNGLPLVFIELKASHKRIENAFNDNIRDYKNTIPQIFWYNAFIIVSNGTESKIGSTSAGWEHFAEWKKINNENEKGIISLDTIIKGTCEKNRLLDIAENFSLFKDNVKIVAKNHQFLGVNEAINKVIKRKELAGKLGVFWHTQGSGKSFSMVFFSQKVLRKIHGNWTFLIVTDREDLDEQIYKNFANVGAVTEEEVRAESKEHLRQLLQEDHRNIFTMIQKFGTNEKDEEFPVLSTRDDIIIITDEAHRSQYSTLAMNMRKALPNASFIAFTGTPLIAEDSEKTREVFGDYVSIYNFKQSIDDNATVPLFYENRIPRVQLINEDLNEDLLNVIEQAELNEKEEEKFEREFVNTYQVITRDARLETVAKDIVQHFMNRGFMGKAMVISVDKATTVKMYEKVQVYWKNYYNELKQKLNTTLLEQEKEVIQKKIQYMDETDMAVIVSQTQNEEETMKKKGVDILPHRIRMNKEDLAGKFKGEKRFKDEPKKLRLVFVCAMWITGFDAPEISTIYLDKPLKSHTLMQTIARANRVFEGKHSGLIVDYIGIFKSLQKALAIYGSTETGDTDIIGDEPVKPKEELLKLLDETVKEALDFCREKKISIEDILKTENNFEKIKLLDDAVDKILVKEDSKKKFLGLVKSVNTLFKAILPDISAEKYSRTKILLSIIAEKISIIINEPVDYTNVENLSEQVNTILDESITTYDYVIKGSKLFDLSKIDFETLRIHFFNNDKKNIDIEKLKTAIKAKLDELIRMNKSRKDFVEKFMQIIEDYNLGKLGLDELFMELYKFARELNEEEKRHMREQLSEEELTVFDILTKPEPKLSRKEQEQVKSVARELLDKLKKELLVLDWRKKQETRAKVKITIEEILDKGLPEIYNVDLFNLKSEMIYEHIYEAYADANDSIYISVA